MSFPAKKSLKIHKIHACLLKERQVAMFFRKLNLGTKKAHFDCNLSEKEQKKKLFPAKMSNFCFKFKRCISTSAWFPSALPSPRSARASYCMSRDSGKKYFLQNMIFPNSFIKIFLTNLCFNLRCVVPACDERGEDSSFKVLGAKNKNI